MQNLDIVVVGGGLLGLLSARALNMAGARVTVLEQNEFGRESSWAGGGILSPLYPWQYSPAVNDLAALSQQKYPQLIEELVKQGGIDPQWTKSGMLVLDSDQFDEASAWATSRQLHFQQWDSRKVHEREPELAAGFKGFVLPDIAQVRNPRLLKCLLHDVQSRGVTLLPRSPVIEIQQQNGQVRGVRTLKSVYPADIVVVCAGAWSQRVLAPLGINPDIRPVRGQMIMYRARPGQIHHITLYRHHYVIPRRDGRTLVGSTLEHTDFDKSTTHQALEGLSQVAVELFPSIKSAPVERHWAGLRPSSPHGIPYICPVPEYKGLFLNAGHFRNGVVLGPASVELLIDQILGREPRLNPAPYQLHRQV